jgi:hypothetical protein
MYHQGKKKSRELKMGGPNDSLEIAKMISKLTMEFIHG